MAFLCLGDQNISPTYYEAEAAQLRIEQLYTPWFLSLHPGGIVISELEYMGATTFAPRSPGPLQFPGNPTLSMIMEALTTDFRRFIADRDYRKCDIMGISGFGDYAELLEVTTVGRFSAGARQIRDKLDTLRNTVNEVYAASLNVDWQASFWLPNPESPFELYMFLPSRKPKEVRYLCYEPTFRMCLTPGVVLYEVHSLELDKVPVTVKVPEDIAEKLKEDYQNRKQIAPTDDAWARWVSDALPDLKTVLTGVAVAGGIAMGVACVAAAIDPVPGDEVPVCAAAMALFRAAGWTTR